jgi:hypothetical protein
VWPPTRTPDLLLARPPGGPPPQPGLSNGEPIMPQVQRKPLSEQALQRIWELFQQGDWGNASHVMNMYTADVQAGRDPGVVVP